MFRKDIAAMKSSLQKLDEQERKYSVELDKVLQEYAELKAQAADLAPIELYEARQTIRAEYEDTANTKAKQVFEDKYSTALDGGQTDAGAVDKRFCGRIYRPSTGKA